MNPFNLKIPTSIHFGPGSLSFLSDPTIVSGNVLIVSTGDFLNKSGILGQISVYFSSNDAINKNGIFTFFNVGSNPQVNQVDQAIRENLGHRIDYVIGVGGGSAMDAAKSIALGLGNKCLIDDFYFHGKAVSNALPIIAIPTTSGTGAELSKGSILSDASSLMKKGVRGDALYPRQAIVDPRLTISVPKKVTIETGFDVFAHGIETFVSKKSSFFTEGLSLQALRIVVSALPKLINDLGNEELRTQMSYASMIMGINLGNASTCLPHRLQYPVGAITNTSHGIGLAALYPAWISECFLAAKDKFNFLQSEVFEKEGYKTGDAVSSILSFMSSIGLAEVRLGDLGLACDQTEKLASLVTGNVQDDPSFVDRQTIISIYQRSF